MIIPPSDDLRRFRFGIHGINGTYLEFNDGTYRRVKDVKYIEDPFLGNILHIMTTSISSEPVEHDYRVDTIQRIKIFRDERVIDEKAGDDTGE